MELQPLNPGCISTGRVSSAGHSGKGVLRRMSRVHSDENYSREESLEDQQSAAPTAKLGEGLPLLQRLRLLKEKQDREERGKQLLSPNSPPPAPSTLSPPALRLEPPPEESQEQEVIGPGLPLIQRLLLLKQKEDHERLTMQTTAAVTADVLAAAVKTQQEAESISTHSTMSPPDKKMKGCISDDSQHSPSSKEQSEDESSLISRKSSLLNRLVSMKHKDSSGASTVKQSSGSSVAVPPQQTSDTNSSSSAEPCMPTTMKAPLLRDKLKLLTKKDNVQPSSSPTSSTTGTVISPPKFRPHSSGKIDSDSCNSSAAVLKKQHSWSLLKKASILSSQSSKELSKEHNVKAPRSAPTHDLPAPSNQVEPCRTSASQSIEEENSDLAQVHMASSNESEVIITCDNDDSESIPSKLPSTLKINEVSSAKSVSLIKQNVTTFIDEDQGQQNAISHSSKVQDKVKCEESLVPAPEEKKEDESKLKEVTTEICSEGGNEPSAKNSRETASLIGTSEEITVQPSAKGMDASALTPAEASTASSQRRRPKPNLLRLQQDAKFYMSIDDLSPEYFGLPFVKKLKILNERQKLAELEQKVAHVFMRSSSLDSSNAISGTSSGSGDSAEYPLDPMYLTRSHSDASAMQYVRSQQLKRASFSRTGSQTSRKDDEEETIAAPPQRPAELPQAPAAKAPVSLTSPESNETLERRNLKSILKKLSASSFFSASTEETKTVSSNGDHPEEPPISGITTAQPASKPLPVDMHKLLRAPTIEGYAARHSKLTKSVTFNRDTLQSPPATATTPTSLSQEPSGNLFLLPAVSEVQTVATALSTCTTTSTITNLNIVTPSTDSFASPTDMSNTPVPQHETLPSVLTAGTVVVTTTLPPVMLQPAISSTVSSMSAPSCITSEPSQMSATTDLPQAPTDTTESALKKKPHVSFLVQGPHQISLSANEKNFFRPSLLLPSHAFLEEEYFNEVIVGIKQVIQGHLVSSPAADKY